MPFSICNEVAQEWSGTGCMRSVVRILLAWVTLACAAVIGYAQSSDQQTVKELRQQLEELRSRMNAIQARLDRLESANTLPASSPTQTSAGQPYPAPPATQSQQVGKETASHQSFTEDSGAAPRLNNAPLDPTYSQYFRIPGTQTLLRIGGFFKTDFIHDLRPAGNTFEFIPATIPVPSPSEVFNSVVSIRPTRLNLDFLIPTTQVGSVRFFVEADFLGDVNATTPRLRHAYAQAENVLIGQTYTNFMDPDVIPDTLDPQGPNGLVNLRNPQFRYGFSLGGGRSFYFSTEEPSSDIPSPTAQFNAQPDSPSPDGTLRFRQEFQRGHLQAAGLFRSIAAFLPSGVTDSVFGWGVNLSGAVRLFGNDNILFEGTYGHGIARYVQDTAGLGIDAQAAGSPPHLRATPETAAEGDYQHYWAARLRSNAVYGFVQVVNSSFEPATTYHRGEYMAGNLIWNPAGSLNVGAEFLYGWQVLKNGIEGNAPRIQFSAKYDFVKQGVRK
jgi:DcaP outer membrane protein